MNDKISIPKLFSQIKNSEKIQIENVQKCTKHIVGGLYFDQMCIYGDNELFVSCSKKGYFISYMSTIYKVKKSFIAEQLELIALSKIDI